MKQGSDFMLQRYQADKTAFVERLFDLTAGSCCEALSIQGKEAVECNLSMLYHNEPGIECSKYWLSEKTALTGIVKVCESPETDQARDSADAVLLELLRDEFLLAKTCKRRSKGSLIAWVLNPSVRFENLYFNVDKIGNPPL